jgi:hypothetical protein
MSAQMAMKYEAAWNQLFYEEPDWKQKSIIEEPNGRMAGELAALAARLAEEGKLLDHERSLGAVKFETPETGVY